MGGSDLVYEIADDGCRLLYAAEAAVDAEIIVLSVAPFAVGVVVVVVLTALVCALDLVDSLFLADAFSCGNTLRS